MFWKPLRRATAPCCFKSPTPKRKESDLVPAKNFCISGVHHVNLVVRDLGRTLAFYGEGLGLPAVRRWMMGNSPAAMIDLGGGNLIEAFQKDLSGAEEEPRWPHLALKVDNVDGAYQSALAAGGRPYVEPKDTTLLCEPPLPIRIAFVYGPDDEKIEFFCEK